MIKYYKILLVVLSLFLISSSQLSAVKLFFHSEKLQKNKEKTGFGGQKYVIGHPQAEISSAMSVVFDLERSRGLTFLGTPHHPMLTKIPIHILAFPNAGQAPMHPYGQIRSRTFGFIWSWLCEAPPLSPNPNFPVFHRA